MSYAAPDTTSANYWTQAPTADTTGSWELGFWIKNTDRTHHVLYTTSNGLVITNFTNRQVMVASNDGTQCFRADLNASSGWTHILVDKTSSGATRVFQDGVECGYDTANNLSATAGFRTTDTVYMSRGGSEVFDPRLISGTVDSTVWAYYRSDVLGGGDKCLPA